jgi:hypothetical protein
VWGSTLVAAAMGAMTIATAVYVAALAVDAPAVAASPGGPFAIDTTILLVVDVLLMALAAGIAAVTSRRGLRALRSQAAGG